jgi:Mycolic acid cyclopropane synthetase
MADRDELEFTYSLTDRIFRLSLGELADFSGAKYDGDFSLSLEEAQRRKHHYVAEQIGFGPGRRALDLGCGWGPLLDFTRTRGGAGVGVTLSSGRQFPGSMLPFGQEQIIRSAAPRFRLGEPQRRAEAADQGGQHSKNGGSYNRARGKRHKRERSQTAASPACAR